MTTIVVFRRQRVKHYKQGYIFRLNVRHLQAYTIFSLPDALSTLGSHSVYNCGTHLIKTFYKGFDFVYKMYFLQIVYK